MTMPASGPLNMGGTTSPVSVAAELGLSLTATISMNQANVRTLAGVGGSGTTWSMSSLYGKSNALNVEYLVVAGGGGGGAWIGAGGGGAGGYRTQSAAIAKGTGFSVTVGAGGAGSTNIGSDGSTSSFNSLASTGGGGGANSYNSGSSVGRPGGSGGGHSGAGIAGQGNNGGPYTQPCGYPIGGGGGGAGGAGYSNGRGGNGSAWLKANQLYPTFLRVVRAAAATELVLGP